MEYKIRQIVALHQQGKRKYNEDFHVPEPGKINREHRLFMVCDGVGGATKGDQASQLVCRSFSDYMNQRNQVFQSKELLTEALRYSEQQMDKHIARHPECEGMATTLTYLSLSQFGVVIAWAGDSRVYQIRNNQIIQKTKDHSLVNSLIAHGEITAEEAKTHPKRNVILRAVTGSQNPTKIDVIHTDDVMPEDYFLLCTDGILEAVSDEDLTNILSTSSSLEETKRQINQLCQEKSNDNYTMILLQLSDVLISDLTAATGSKHLEKTISIKKESTKVVHSRRSTLFSLRNLVIIGILILFLAGSCCLLNPSLMSK